MHKSMTLLFSLTLSALLALWLGGCPVAPVGDDDDDNDDDATGDDDTGDDDTGDDDTGDDDTGDDDTVEDQTIYEVQTGTYPEDTEVFLAGVIVTSGLSEAPPGFFVQEPDYVNSAEFSGIFVYVADKVVDMIAGDIVPGNLVDVTGMYVEYYGFSEISVDAAEDVVYAGTTNLTPTAVSACDVGTGGSMMSEYEGVFVQVDGVAVSSENPDGPDDDFGEFEVDGCLRIDDLFFDADPTMGQSFTSIKGPMYYSWDNAKLAPRSANDLQ